LVYISILFFPKSYICFFEEFCYLPFSIHAQNNEIYLSLFSPLERVF
jgi:hypothetical protein